MFSNANISVKNCRMFRVLICATLFLTGYAYAFSNGDGTAGNPYQISTRADLEAVNNNLAASYILMNDIDLTGITYTQAVISNFYGFFNGNGFKITNLTISASDKDFIGLFGYTDTNAVIKNLGVEECNISGYNYVGGLTGINSGSNTNCYSTGSVSGTDFVGGFVGHNWGSNANCYSTGSVSGTDFVGGLVGSNEYGINTNCYSTGNVSGSSYVGGLVGSNSRSNTNCYSTGSVSGQYYVGGLVGENYGGNTNCYSTGSVSGSIAVGGLVGSNSGSNTNCFWNKETSGQTTSAGGTGKTTAQMQDINTYLDAAWDFIEEDSNGIEDDWYLGASGYPEIYVFSDSYQPNQLQGEGTVINPYLIYDKYDLVIIKQDLQANYRLMADIDLTGIVFGHAVIRSFAGKFDGNGFKVKNVSINQFYTGYTGFFGSISQSGIVKNLAIVGCNISGQNYVGCLAGLNYGAITSCYSTGIVNGENFIGGLVGNNSGTIIASYAIVNTGGNSSVGGLAGKSSGTITNCYATGNVSGSTSIGGLIGERSGVILNSFWDIETSGQTISAGGTGKTTMQMKDRNTFLSSTWDFVDEESNGIYDIWYIEANEYPKLSVFFDSYSPRDLQGDGTAAVPYLIYDKYDLLVVNQNLQAEYKLMADIDLGGITFWQGVIGSEIYPFAGKFDGGDFLIKNLQINSGSKDCIGFFGYTSSEGEVKDIGIENYNILGKNSVGGLVGSNGGKIFNCYATGSIDGSGSIGGLVGDNLGIVINSYATVNANGNITIGGLVGRNSGGTIATCYAEGIVSCGTYLSSGFAGGLVGTNSSGIITNCYSTASVKGTHIGGLVAYNNSGTVTNCYSRGFVSGTYAGGLMQINSSDGIVNNCFWNIQDSGQSTSGGGTGITISQMKSVSTFISTGWDLTNIWVMSEIGSKFWGYPILYWQQIFTVTFFSGTHGSINSGDAVQAVAYDHSAISPEVTADSGWVFIGWDVAFDNVKSDLTVTAQYAEEVPILSLSGDLNFGEVLPGNIKIRQFTISNTGYKVLNVSELKYPAGFSGDWGGGEITAGGSQDVTVTFAPVALKAYFGNITVVSDATSGGNTITCYGIGVSRVIGVSGDMAFGNVPIGSTVVRNITITNSGASAVTVSGISLPDGFSGNWSGTIAAGGVRNVEVTFAPTESKSYGGTIIIQSDATGGDNTIECFGVGVSGGILLAGSFDFGSLPLNSQSQATLTITNTGSGFLTVSGITYPEGFSGSWSGQIAGGASQEVTVTFAPTEAKSYDGTITVQSDAMSGVNTIDCSGKGRGGGISLYDNLVFGDVAVNSQSQLTFTITNTDIGLLTVSGITYPEGFSGNWAGEIAAGGYQEVTVTFAPTEARNYDGTITVQSDAVGGVNTIDCSGEGRGGGISLAGSLGFGDKVVNTVSQLTLTISNTDIGLLTVGGISLPEGFSGGWSGTIAAGGAQEINVTFMPSAMVGYGGVITVHSDAVSGDNTVECSGFGIKRIIGVSGELFFGRSVVGGQATLEFTITNSGNRALAVSGISLPYGFAGDWAGEIAAGGSQVVEVAFVPQSQGDYDGLAVVQNNSTEGESGLACYGFVYVGDGTAGNPYRVGSRYHLEAVNDELGACYKLTADIDLEGIVYDAAVIAPYFDETSAAFSGSFNGGGFVIGNLSIDAQAGSYLGLFGCVGESGSVCNLGVENGYIGGLDYVGLIAGQNNGTITASYTSGDVAASTYIGGAIGENNGTISDCYAMTNVSGQWITGGLVGVNWGDVLRSYSVGAVQADNLAGGFAGVNANITTGCFWDIQTSGISTGGGAGKTTAQMYDYSTYLSGLWDFVNETANGRMDLWYMPQDGYPMLWWQAGKGDINYDGVVDDSDLTVMAWQWLSLPQGGQRLVGDINIDGAVDLADYAILASRWAGIKDN